MALTNKQEDWYKFAPGQKLNPDLAYGLQCVDTVDHYAQFIFGVPWQQCVGAVPGGARQLFSVMPSKYWIKIKNDPAKPDQLPQKGDVIVYDGWAANPYGHTAPVFAATKQYADLLQQDGFAAPLQFVDGGWYSNKPIHRAKYNWPGLPGGFPGRVIGWCRPRPEMIIGSNPIKFTMDGIDIASYQSSIKQAAVPAQFVIVKATEGVGYTNPAFKAQLADARKDGALVGLYHFQRGGTGAEEANYFLKQTAGLIDDKTIIFLDFEAAELLNAGGVTKAYDWLVTIAAKTKKMPILYMNLSVSNTLNWSRVQTAGFNRLWLAQYPTDTVQNGYGPKGTRGTPKNWHVVMWQYSQHGRLPGYAGDLDLNLFYGTETQWNKYAAPSTATPTGGLGTNTGVDLSAAEVNQIKTHITNECNRLKREILAGTGWAVQAYRGVAVDENGKRLPVPEGQEPELDPLDAYAHLRLQTRMDKVIDKKLDEVLGKVGAPIDVQALKAELLDAAQAAFQEGIKNASITFTAKEGPQA